jgi:hypothetical protein
VEKEVVRVYETATETVQVTETVKVTATESVVVPAEQTPSPAVAEAVTEATTASVSTETEAAKPVAAVADEPVVVEEPVADIPAQSEDEKMIARRRLCEPHLADNDVKTDAQEAPAEAHEEL